MPLSRDEVIDGALALLDEVGLDALTMRRLAQSLGVQAGAIYWHFADRQDLEDAMADAMMIGLLEPPLKGKWDRKLAELMRRVAGALLRRRDGARLAVRALRPGPHGLAVSNAMMSILAESGWPDRATLWAAGVIGYFLLGYVTDLQATEAAKSRGLVKITRKLMKSIDRQRYPRLVEIGKYALTDLMTAKSAKERFEYGLEVILTGLKRTRPRPQRRKR